jgi:hypothetical protein
VRTASYTRLVTLVDLEALVRDELRSTVGALVRRLVPELVAETLNGRRLLPLKGRALEGATNGTAPASQPARVPGHAE